MIAIIIFGALVFFIKKSTQPKTHINVVFSLFFIKKNKSEKTLVADVFSQRNAHHICVSD